MKKHINMTNLLIFLPALGACLYWALTLNQPLIDQHSFRQAQTALTALFMQPGLNGFLNYETPVMGSPWAIPFELPLFQWFANGLSKHLPLSFSACGRLLSIIFGIGCVGPALGLLHRFGVKDAGKICFSFLYFSSAIYLYWNRAYMIESTALFFTLTSLYLYTLVRDGAFNQARTLKKQSLVLAGFWLSLSLSLLVKATTGLPILLLIILDLIWQLFKSFREKHESFKSIFYRLIPTALIAFAALLILKGWTLHADAVKSLNPIGIGWTSEALKAWNYGTVDQRLSLELWLGVLIKRMLTPIGAIPFLSLVILSLAQKQNHRQRTLILVSIILALIPLLVFSNLHIIHTYYQMANQIYLLIGISAAFDGFFQPFRPKWQQIVALCAVALFAFGSYNEFKVNYFESSLAQTNDRLEIGKLVKAQTSPVSGILVFGDDWNSEFSFHSQRRSLSLPDGLINTPIQEVLLQNPSSSLGGMKLGAIITKTEILSDKLAEQSCPIKQVKAFGEWKAYICKP